MSRADLDALFDLNAVDKKISGIKSRAAGLDIGKKEHKQAKALQAELAEVGDEAKKLSQELRDKELQDKQLEDKIATFKKKMFDGSANTPREIRDLEAEVAQLEAQRDKIDARVLELYELEPPAREKAEKLSAKIDELQKIVAEKQAAAMEKKTAMEAEFAKQKAIRPEAVERVPEPVLKQYEAIRKRTGDVAMAEVNDSRNCEECGMSVPEKSIELAKQGRLGTCEGCSRILYVPDV